VSGLGESRHEHAVQLYLDDREPAARAPRKPLPRVLRMEPPEQAFEMRGPNMRSKLMLAVALGASVAAAILAASAFARGQAASTLTGTVGKNNAYKISLADSKGKIVKTLKAGTYTFVIHDDSSIHNYELDGPHGKSWSFTSIAQIGTKTMTLKLTPGKYKAYCEAHESQMFQHFTVT
jgi:plastocyanin